jgi:hypothetical protein
VCSWELLEAERCDQALARAKSAVFEIVARDFGTLSRACWRPVSVAAAGLRGRRSRWVAAGAPADRSGSITVPAKGSIAVSVRPSGGDRSSVPRLLRLPITHLATPAKGAAVVKMRQQPRSGPVVPCATPTRTLNQGPMFLPIPAGRRASDLTFVLRAPPGTRLGRPEEIVLDGKQP